MSGFSPALGLFQVVKGPSGACSDRVGEPGRFFLWGSELELRHEPPPSLCHPDRSDPIFSSAPNSGASGRGAEGSLPAFLFSVTLQWAGEHIWKLRSRHPVRKGGKSAGWLWSDLRRNLTRVTPCRGGLRSLLLGLFHFALSSVFVSHARRLPQLANHS